MSKLTEAQGLVGFDTCFCLNLFFISLLGIFISLLDIQEKVSHCLSLSLSVCLLFSSISLYMLSNWQTEEDYYREWAVFKIG